MAARAEGDIDNVRNLLFDSAALRVIGSAEEEWTSGYDRVMSVLGTHWDTLRDLGDTRLRFEAFEHGDTGWAAVEGRRTTGQGEFTYRTTFVLLLEGGAWRIAQIHFSIPVPNEQIDGVELSQTLSELLDSLKTGPDLDSLADSTPDTSTIVFTDVVGSTELARSLGDRVWSRVIGDHLEVLRGIVEGERGFVVKTLGDGGMYAFSSASAALQAAIGIQRALQGADTAVRVGAHSGDVLRNDDDYVGLTVNKAARIAAAADGGQILVSSTTAGLVDPSVFEFGAPITVELKGLEGVHQLLPLVWARSDA